MIKDPLELKITRTHQLDIAIATASDLGFICQGFPKIRPLARADGNDLEVNADWISSLLVSKSHPLYQLWQFAVARMDSQPIGFIQTVDFSLLQQHLNHGNDQGLYRVNPAVLKFDAPLRVINSVYVEDRWRKLGVGKFLIETQRDRYRDTMGILYSGENSDSVGFYEACGFSPLKGLERNGHPKEILLFVDRAYEFHNV